MARTRLASSLFLVFLFFFHNTEAKEILVGGKPNAWKIPSSPSDSLNKWSASVRFRVGDSLVWKNENGGKESVLEVTKEAYVSCNVTNAIAEHRDGDIKVKLVKPGALFFISGEKGKCEQGQKLIVVVMSHKNRLTAISPAPSPAGFDGPAVAPTSGALRIKYRVFMSAMGTLGFLLVVLM